MADSDRHSPERTDDRHWRLEDGGHGLIWLRFDKAGSGTNVLAAEVIAELNDKLARVEAMNPKAVVIYSAKKNGFIAGADINEFTTLQNPEQAFEHIRQGQKVFARLEALPCTTVAMIHGFALGGGLELALACDYRVAADDSRTVLGFPEVQLGIHPGFGGTVRSVAVTGVFAAMDLMLTGRNVHARKAKETGLVDQLAGPDHLKDVTTQLALNPPPKTQPSPWLKLLQLAPFRPIVAGDLRKRVAARVKRKHYPAPYAIIDLWQHHAGASEASYIAEARSIAELMCGETARNLVRVFLLRDRLKSLGKQSDATFNHVHVIGAGTMGGDIASWCALQGLDVTLQDREQRYIDPALERGRKLFEKKLKSDAKVREAQQRLRSDLEGSGVSKADVIVEAIIEDAEAKENLYREVEPKMGAQALLATNTSSIRLETLETALQHPDRFAGLHFFNPVAKMQLVEVIHADSTTQTATDKALAFARRINRLPVPVKSSPGFLVNRILMPYLMEALEAVGEGIAPEAVDKAATDFGMPMGPVELADTVGLDICLSVGKILAQAYDKPVPRQLEDKVKAKQLGRKTGQGFYRYEDGKPNKDKSKARNRPDDLTDRLILPMVNEAVACLREGIVADGDLIDAGVIFGTGFAPFRGGPIQYARSAGAANLRDRLQTLAARYGERFTPDAGWDTFK
ncbi:MAG TPA: 3-hydroxyacyl-CoA dehydrogenase NAD-binding domain-containing protein [Gammaproteobacteria bacterium]|nr:3-hydroxyacyl-CoA dehydrogenase NAD-binding domain-containing protein [Gammaproteobacteria bacterium]